MSAVPEVPAGYRLLSSTPAPKWGIPASLGVLAVWVGVSLAFAVPLLVTIGDTPPLLLVLSVAVPTIVMALAALWVARVRGNGPVADFALAPRVRDFAIGIPAGLAMMVVAGLIAALMQLGSDSEIPVAAGDVFDLVSSSPFAIVLLIFTIAVIAPIAEEIAYRGMLYSAIERRFSAAAAVIFSAIIFAALHFEPQRFPILLALGLALGELRRRTRSTTSTIAAHMLINSVAAAGMLASLATGSSGI